jgi:hypothetical protein
MIPMVALVAFDRNGKHLKVGDPFNAYPIEAASLRYQKKADFVRPGAAVNQGYGTRHMTARTPGTPAPPPEAPREASSAPSQTAEAESTQTTDASGSRSRRGARSQGYQDRQLNQQRGASEK